MIISDTFRPSGIPEAVHGNLVLIASVTFNGHNIIAESKLVTIGEMLQPEYPKEPESVPELLREYVKKVGIFISKLPQSNSMQKPKSFTGLIFVARILMSSPRLRFIRTVDDTSLSTEKTSIQSRLRTFTRNGWSGLRSRARPAKAKRKQLRLLTPLLRPA